MTILEPDKPSSDLRRTRQVTVLKSILILTIALSSLLCSASASDDDGKTTNWKAERERLRYVYRSRPARIDEPLRAENISDGEIREIQAVTAVVFPGAIANVSGVTAGCPCEEGATCDSQVWILAYRNNQYDGLMLSRIDNEWAVGPVQKWWIEYDRIQAEIRKALSSKEMSFLDKFRIRREKQLRHQEEYPSCGPEVGPESDE